MMFTISNLSWFCGGLPYLDYTNTILPSYHTIIANLPWFCSGLLNSLYHEVVLIVIMIICKNLVLQICPDSVVVVYTTRWWRRPKGFPVLPRWAFAFPYPHNHHQCLYQHCHKSLDHHLHLKRKEKPEALKKLANPSSQSITFLCKYQKSRETIGCKKTGKNVEVDFKKWKKCDLLETHSFIAM